jgi:hypothetical protein
MMITIKTLVREKQITLTDLARQLGYSRVHITNVSNGAPAGPRLAQKLVAWSGGRLKTDDLLYSSICSQVYQK